MAVIEERGIEIDVDMQKDTVYKVTKGNAEGSIQTGDLIYIDKYSGMLINPKAKGWLTPDELTPSVMDFQYERMPGYKVYRCNYHTSIRRCM